MTVKAHSIFKRSEENLFFEFPISLTDAALGTVIEVPTIDGKKAKVKKFHQEHKVESSLG